jgi:hypothetical protein
VVEGHGDVGAEGTLDLHRALGSEHPGGSVHVTLEGDAVFFDAAETFEREDLEAAGVGEHGAIPGGEAMEATHGLDHVLARADVQVIGVAEDDLRAGTAHHLRREALDGRLCANGHKCRSLHLSMRSVQRARASEAIGGMEGEGEWHLQSRGDGVIEF